MPLTTLENTLQDWMRDELPLPEDVGDISFESPDGTWGTSISRPTMNLFLFDIARGDQQPVALPARRDAGGTLVQERPAPAVAFSYLVSAWGGGVREEHELLGDAVKAILRTPFLVTPELPGPLQLALAEHTRPRDLWGNLGGRLRASMILVATTAVPLEKTRRVAPLAERVEVGLLRKEPAG